MKLVAGIDVSKDSLQVCLKEQSEKGIGIKRTHSFSNDYNGFKELLKRSGKDPSEPVAYVMEATGSYYENVACFLYDQGREVYVVLANRIKHYAKSLNVKTKTDKVDASIIAGFGIEREMSKREPVCAEYRQLRDLCRELLSIRKEVNRAKNQRHAMQHAHEKNAFMQQLKADQTGFYEDSLKRMEAEIHRLPEAGPSLKKGVEEIVKVKGLGMLTVVIVLCETNGFQSFSNIRQVVSYAGLDVEMKESGAFKGKTKISKKGNSRIRQALYMPALSATVHNKNIGALYERIAAKNPKQKCKGIVAGMRKLLILIFVLWKKKEEYNENYRWGKEVKNT
jgi:transposase